VELNTFASICIYTHTGVTRRRPQWRRVLRGGSAVARLLRFWVRIPSGTWMFVCYDWCVLPGRGLCDWLITRPEESYRMWCVVVCDLETSRMRRSCPNVGCCTKIRKISKILRFWFRIPSEAWKSVCCECCMLSDRGPCNGLITRPEESYRLWCVFVFQKHQEWGVSGPLGAVAPKERKITHKTFLCMQ
jgi:hypothetical protein